MSWETTLRATIMTTTMTKMSKRKTKEQLSYLSCWSFLYVGKIFWLNFSHPQMPRATFPHNFNIQYSAKVLCSKFEGNCSNVKNSEFNFPENFTTLFSIRILISNQLNSIHSALDGEFYTSQVSSIFIFFFFFFFFFVRIFLRF